MALLSRTLAAITLALLLSARAAEARTEHHVIQSQFLASIGAAAERELSVYVPDVPPRSGGRYPVFYLFHGYTGTNRTFLGAGYPDFGELIDAIHIDRVMEDLIASGAVQPMIVVFPNLKRATLQWTIPVREAYTRYISEEVVPFVDATYPTIPRREARAIAGHSLGGNDSIYMGLARPDLFNFIAAYSPYFLYAVGDALLADHDQASVPVSFWVYAGEKDGFTKIPPETHAMVDLLAAHGLPCVSSFDGSDHWVMLGTKIAESIVYFSQTVLGSATAVGTTSWGSVKEEIR